MEYRIKVETYKDGREKFRPQVKKFFGWADIGDHGTASYSFFCDFNTEKYAREVIALHKSIKGGFTTTIKT